MISFSPDSAGPEYDLRTVATYNCNEGFVLIGEDKIRTCVDISNGPSGEFNGTAPTCEGMWCCLIVCSTKINCVLALCLQRSSVMSLMTLRME